MEVHEKLTHIQRNLKAPKNQWNPHGRFWYRNCEDILNGLKPLLEECGMSLIINDDVIQVGQRYYIQATATLTDNESGQAWAAKAFAREAEGRKGFDDSQLTGSTSSYARKYALNGLFCIDDNKDADEAVEAKQGDYKKPVPTPEKKQADSNGGTPKAQSAEAKQMLQALVNMAEEKGLPPETLSRGMKKYFPQAERLEELTEEQLSRLMDKISQMEARS